MMDEIFEMIKEDFSKTWKMRMRGETMEVITPISTTNGFFVSLFISPRDFGYVVSDGGTFSIGEYDLEMPNSRLFKKLMLHYTDVYGISEIEARGRRYFYKAVKTPAEIAPAVLELSSFLGNIIDVADAFERNENEDRCETFKKKATDYIKEAFANRECRFSVPIAGVPDIDLSAYIPGDSGLTLVNYVSGASSVNFSGNLCRSACAFQIISQQQLDVAIKNKVHLIDTDSIGFKDERSRPYLDIITKGNGAKVIHWEDRAMLSQITA